MIPPGDIRHEAIHWIVAFAENNGERSRSRTCDLLIKSQLLYQLSYAPVTIIVHVDHAPHHAMRRGT